MGILKMEKSQASFFCNMKYKIIEKPDYTNRVKIGIQAEPENVPLMFFLSGLNILLFPFYIFELLNNRSFGVQNARFNFYHEMDGGLLLDFYDRMNREMQEDEIEITFYDGKTHYSVIGKNDFLKIFYDYSLKLLEIYGVEKMTQPEYETYWIEHTKHTRDNGWYLDSEKTFFNENPLWKNAMEKYLELLKARIDCNLDKSDIFCV